MSVRTKADFSWSRWHTRLHKTLIRKKDLLPPGACLLLSISGGQDSMVLLKLMMDLQRLYNWKLNIWHGDHGWHRQSTHIAKELQKWCEHKDLNFYCHQGSKEQLHNEEAARNWRYKNLIAQANIISKQETNSPCNYVVTGHTSSDRTETLLLNLARGTYLGGLGSLRYTRKLEGSIKLVRPLLPFSRKETTTICKEMDLPIWVDPSNLSVEFTRNIIRQEVIPVLERIYPGSSLRIASLAERLSHVKDNQDALTSLAIKAMIDSEGISRRMILKIPIKTREVILAKWLEQNGLPQLKAIQLEEICFKTAEKMPPGSINLQKGWQIIWTRESIKLFNDKK